MTSAIALFARTLHRPPIESRLAQVRAVHFSRSWYFLGMYVSMSRLRIAPSRADELIAAFRNRARLVDDADGFIGLEVWQSDRDLGELIMVSRWRDRDAFKVYMKSESHRTSHARIDPGLDREIKLEALEHLHTYSVVAR
jgi:heme oxygenase (mycobilin-producing)